MLPLIANNSLLTYRHLVAPRHDLLILALATLRATYCRQYAAFAALRIARMCLRAGVISAVLRRTRAVRSLLLLLLVPRLACLPPRAAPFFCHLPAVAAAHARVRDMT